jgi:hypothetical protein
LLKLSQKFTGLQLSGVVASGFKSAAVSGLDLAVGDLSCGSSFAVVVKGEGFSVDNNNYSGIGGLVFASSDSSEFHFSAQHNLGVRTGWQTIVDVEAQVNLLRAIDSIGLLVCDRSSHFSVLSGSFLKRDTVTAETSLIEADILSDQSETIRPTERLSSALSSETLVGIFPSFLSFPEHDGRSSWQSHDHIVDVLHLFLNVLGNRHGVHSDLVQVQVELLLVATIKIGRAISQGLVPTILFSVRSFLDTVQVFGFEIIEIFGFQSGTSVFSDAPLFQGPYSLRVLYEVISVIEYGHSALVHVHAGEDSDLVELLGPDVTSEISVSSVCLVSSFT